MSNTLDELNELRELRINEVKGHQGHIESLKDEIRRLEGEIRGLDMAIEICTRSENEAPTSPQTQTVKVPQRPNLILQSPAKYTGKGLTESILDIVQSAGYGPGLNTRQIEDILKQNGFNSGAKSLYSSIYTLARRMVKNGIIREIKIGDTKAYAKK